VATDHDRRALVGTAAACAVAAVSGGFSEKSQAQSGAPRVKGPRVYLDYDQAELDAAYDQSVYAPNARDVQGRMRRLSAAARKHLGTPKRFAYGPTDIEKLDVYPATRPDAPIQIFIHGGAWRSGTAAEHADAAELFHHAGAVYVVPDFTLVQDAADSLRSMAEQVRRSIAWVYKNATEIGGDGNRIYISGHSSGAHLAGVALVTDWRREHGIPDDFIEGALLCSGMYDLKGPRLSARSNYVKFDDAMEAALSAQRHLDRIRASVLLVHGTLETPEFQRQTREFAAALQRAGKAVELIVAEGFNHFEIRETFANPFGIVGRAILAQMKLSLPGI
jgi:arylformamidase